MCRRSRPAQPWAARPCKAWHRWGKPVVHRGLPPCSVKQCRSSCNASCAQQPSTTPSSDCKFTPLYEAGLERTRPRIAAMTSAEQLGVLARTCRALTGHRRGCKAGRYSHRQHRSPKVLNFEELWWPTTCSASKNSSEAEVRSQLARAAAAKTAHGHRFSSVGAGHCDNSSRESIEMILSY